MFIKNTAGQHIGFCLISVATGEGLAGLAPIAWVSKDGSHPAVPGAGVVKDLGNGQYDYGPTMSESNCNTLSVILTANFACPQEKTVFPFDATLPILGVMVAQTPTGPNFGPVSTITVQNSDGLLWTNLGSGNVALRLQNASNVQTGTVSTGAQTFSGPKTFAQTLTVAPGAFGLPAIVLDTAPTSTFAFSAIVDSTAQRVECTLLDSATNTQTRFLMTCSGTVGENFLIAALFNGSFVDACYATTDSGGGLVIGQWANVNGMQFSGGLYTGGPIANVSTAQGGTGSNMSITGPGVVYQPSVGGGFVVIAPAAMGNVLTDTGTSWQSLPPSGSAPTIGHPVVGATPGQLLYVDGSGDLANSGQMTFPGFLAVDGTNGANAGLFEDVTNAYAASLGFFQGGGPQWAARFTDPSHTVFICDGTNAVSYTPGGSAVWNGPAPTDVWAALDRLTAYLALNFPGNTPP